MSDLHFNVDPDAPVPIPAVTPALWDEAIEDMVDSARDSDWMECVVVDSTHDHTEVRVAYIDNGIECWPVEQKWL